jgi:hypothetical protein
MNTSVFKQLIKEAVREAVREEFKQVLAEHAASQLVSGNHTLMTESSPLPAAAKLDLRQKMSSAFGGFSKPSNIALPEEKLAPPVKGDFSAFLMDAAEHMTPQDIAGLKNLG